MASGVYGVRADMKFPYEGLAVALIDDDFFEPADDFAMRVEDPPANEHLEVQLSRRCHLPGRCSMT